MISITINEKKLFLSRSCTLIELFQFLNLQFSKIVIERNCLVVPRTVWDKTYVSENDKLEFLTIVGGG